MRMSYNRLWKLLIDKNMKKSDLRKVAGISSSSLVKLGKGENVTTDVILKICVALDCRVEDIMEIIKDETLTFLWTVEVIRLQQATITDSVKTRGTI